jgi:hypothetical protein
MTIGLLKDTSRLFIRAAADLGFSSLYDIFKFLNFLFCMYLRNFQILHEFHESIFRHASRERAR